MEICGLPETLSSMALHRCIKSLLFSPAYHSPFIFFISQDLSLFSASARPTSIPNLLPSPSLSPHHPMSNVYPSNTPGLRSSSSSHHSAPLGITRLPNISEPSQQTRHGGDTAAVLRQHSARVHEDERGSYTEEHRGKNSLQDARGDDVLAQANGIWV